MSDLHQWGIQWIGPNLWQVWCSKENHHHLGNWRNYEAAESQLNAHLSRCVETPDQPYHNVLSEDEVHD